MTDPIDRAALGIKEPERVTPTAAWREEQVRKQHAYAESRRLWTARFQDGSGDPEDDAPTFASAPEPLKAKGRRRVHDPRQTRLDFG
jgi:hypothetical protein